MLHEFIELNRDAIIARTRDRVRSRPWPSVAPGEVEHGVPLFLTQLAQTLRLETTSAPFPADAIGAAAARHGRDLLRSGFTVSQVVHDYGDICQTITALAVEQRAPITVEEFHTLNRCLDTAIAEAVTEHARVTAEARSAEEIERLGHAAHELRDSLNTAILAFHTLKRGAVAINGSTGAILGGSLMTLREVIDRTPSEVRLEAGQQRRARLPVVVAFIDEIAATGILHSEYRHIQFTVDAIDPALSIDADPQLLASAVMIARKAVRAHGGDIRIRNMPGKGCVFIIEVPLATEEFVPEAAV
jgi:signal transduction histidine kinase